MDDNRTGGRVRRDYGRDPVTARCRTTVARYAAISARTPPRVRPVGGRGASLPASNREHVLMSYTSYAGPPPFSRYSHIRTSRVKATNSTDHPVS